MSSTALAETEEDVFDLTDAVPETELLDSSLQKAKAQLSIKTRRHRPSRSRLRDSLSSTEGEDSLDGKSYSGLLSGSCSPLHVSLRCPSPFSDLHPSFSPAKKDQAFTFETAEKKKNEQRRRSMCLLNPTSPTHLIKGNHLQKRLQDNTDLRQWDHVIFRQSEHMQRHQEDCTDLLQSDHLHENHPCLHKGNHLQEDHSHLPKEYHLPKDHSHLPKWDHLQDDHSQLSKGDHLHDDHSHMPKWDHLQDDHSQLPKGDHLQDDHCHMPKWDHLQDDHSQLPKGDHLQECLNHMHKRDHLQKDHTHCVQLHEENHSLLLQRENSQSEDDTHDVGSDEPSSPTVLLDKKTRRRFLDLGVTLRHTYGKVRRERANRHAAENREPAGAESRPARTSVPHFVPFSWLSERLRCSGSPKMSSQSPAKTLSEDTDSRSGRKESSQPYHSLSDHSDEGCDVQCVVKKKSIPLPFSSSGRDRTEKQSGVQRDKKDNGHDGDGIGQKLLTSQSQHKHSD